MKKEAVRQPPVCHPERSEGSPESRYWREILRSAQKDNDWEKEVAGQPYLLYHLHGLPEGGDDFTFRDFCSFAEFGFTVAGDFAVFDEDFSHGTAFGDAGGFQEFYQFDVFGVYFKGYHGVSILGTKVTNFCCIP